MLGWERQTKLPEQASSEVVTGGPQAPAAHWVCDNGTSVGALLRAKGGWDAGRKLSQKHPAPDWSLPPPPNHIG